MPIKKIISIKNVGRLVNCTQKGPEFNKYSVIFAENGRGKTTLCAEEDLLAHYLLNFDSAKNRHFIDTKEPDINAVNIGEDEWKDFAETQGALAVRGKSTRGARVNYPCVDVRRTTARSARIVSAVNALATYS